MSLFLTWVEEKERFTLSTAGYVIFIALIILLLLLCSIVTQSKEKKQMSAKQLAFCGMSIALATVASVIKFSFPFTALTGGSITLLSMFFICFVGYLYGPKIGIMTAVAYGILQLIISPKIYFPMQILVDYVLAFGALGLSGFFYKRKGGLLTGYLVGVTGRWIFAAISGIIFFGEYAWDGWNVTLYSIVYNATYIVPEAIITVIIIALPPVRAQLKRVRDMA
jgi:thiamine transporter